MCLEKLPWPGRSVKKKGAVPKDACIYTLEPDRTSNLIPSEPTKRPPLTEPEALRVLRIMSCFSSKRVIAKSMRTDWIIWRIASRL